jgi:hemoglobin-like flavoprotein
MTLDIDSLETSFDAIAPRGDEVVEDFYNRIFATAPALRALFPDDMTHHRTMVLATLVLVRKSLRNFDEIVPTLRSLGARHVGYGVQPEHYAVAGPLLIEAMAHVAGDAWRPEYARAWAGAWAALVTEMQSGAEEAATPSREPGSEPAPRHASASTRTRTAGRSRRRATSAAGASSRRV